MRIKVIQPAIDLLQTGGYQASKNGTGVLVDVPPGEKARPIGLLSQADIVVDDFEIE